jgi:hypothetical protein
VREAQVSFFLKKARDGVGRPRSSGTIGSIVTTFIGQLAAVAAKASKAA